ncbi:MAG: asparaginase [Conexibacter sp.]
MTIRVVATGGTIASLADPQTRALPPAVGAEELVQSVPGLDRFGPVAVEEVDHVNGWNVTPATMLEVSRRVEAALADDDVAGVVVTHGTDTVEETAFLCDVTIRSEKPVVFAAAMRSGSEIAADGPRNLLCAAEVAANPAARGLGALLVLGDEIHAARWARKQDSFRTSAFASPGRGPIGVVTPGSVRVLMDVPRRVVVPRPAAFDRPVPIVQTYTGMEEGLIETVIDATGAAGLVLEGTGLGNVPGSAERGIRAARERGLPVVVATRVPTGGTGAVYGGPGGGVTLRELGVVQAAALSAAKARLLLMLLLADGADRDAIGDELAGAACVLESW